MNKLRIHNTLSGKKEVFKPIKGKKINLFVCGPTVYDYSHIGHARTYIFFDSFARYLKQLGFKVFYLQNITDLDDKIIAKAREKDVSPESLALAFAKEHLNDMKALKINSVSKYAKATDYIKEIISQTKRLLKKGYGYKLDDGIYYNISKFKNYGKLSGRTALAAEDAVSRIDYSRNKKNRGDFCLWKFSVESEPSWPSPWGKGRPGWHIEDTAITEKFFGPQYDIHGGSRDLIFPHHEAEISQMEAISGKKPLAKYWMHTGFLTVDGQKMSKSLGNFITINDFLKRHPANYLRFFVIKSLWRSSVDYSESAMIEVKSAVEKIEEFLRKLQIPNCGRQIKILHSKLLTKTKVDFYKQLDDDFNTSKAFAVIFDFIKKTNQFLDKNCISKKQADEIYKFFEEINNIFEIFDFEKTKKPTVPAALKRLINVRERYRKEKNWQKADEIRIEIENKGYLLEDTKEGQIVKNIK